MRLKPTKMVLIVAISFALLHLIAAVVIIAQRGHGHAGILFLYIDFPLVWLANLSEAGRTILASRGNLLFVVLGGTVFYFAIGALIGNVMQLFRDASTR